MAKLYKLVRLKFIIVIIIIFLSFLYRSNSVKGINHGFIAQDDVYVSSAYSNVTFPNTDFLNVRNGSYREDTYLRFETSTIGRPIVDISLEMYISAVNADMEVRIIATDTDWSEETITWDSKPTNYGEVALFHLFSGDEGMFKIYLHDNGVPAGIPISFCLKLNFTGYFRIVSKENSNYLLAYAPTLYFSTQDIPGTPVIMLILIGGFLGVILVFISNHKKKLII